MTDAPTPFPTRAPSLDSPTPFPVESDALLWCLHVRGPDDIVPVRSYREARALADWFTAVDRGNMADERCPLFAAVPAIWPWSAERHAASLVSRKSHSMYRHNAPCGDIVSLTKIALDHPLCTIGKAARKTASDATITALQAENAALRVGRDEAIKRHEIVERQACEMASMVAARADRAEAALAEIQAGRDGEVTEGRRRPAVAR